LIAALWLVSTVFHQAKYRKLMQALLLISLVTVVLLLNMDLGAEEQSAFGDVSTLLLLLLLPPLVLMSVIAHEVSHGWVALQLGDPTARQKGRLTFDPFRHLSFRWTVLFPITTFYLFGLGFIMPKPVPINPRNFENPRKDIMWVGLAGPAINIFIVLFFALILGSGVIPHGDVGSPVRAFIMLLIIVNAILAMFNLIPIPPLDGSRVLAGLLPARQTAFLMGKRIQILGLVLVFTLVIGTHKSIGIDQVLITPIRFVWGVLGLDRGELETLLRG
jgi:Zn-dependent protease